MAVTPETVARHELCGLPARVAAADDPSLVGTQGRVVSETKSTLRVETDSTRTKQVPKAGATFEFDLTGESETDSAFVTVEGTRLLAPPARRTELSSDSKWR
ncbi:ribonuclease P protein component 1 [Halococcus hamelinensis]|uniref:Ribonuclease P protein component 1 n=1 Tax=Halococcus hamelinensis 100A6 TaxID=1132509 RepID=M0LTP5_9EURY|nr:ribonuclease P protein component 1 [Halococcus hamelinensis]EMA35779.1 ribonuclease P protein component 1 [Halococcus hamelinensis 100A6]